MTFDIFESVFDFNSFKMSEDALSMMHVIAHIGESLEKWYLLLASITQQSGVFQGQLLALVLHLVNDFPFLLKTIPELSIHFLDQVIIKINLGINFLGEDWLQEITFFIILIGLLI